VFFLSLTYQNLVSTISNNWMREHDHALVQSQSILKTSLIYGFASCIMKYERSVHYYYNEILNTTIIY
jgi:hypothetical protein